MLSLESDRWSELHHAYGLASDIPGLLRRLYDLPAVSEQGEPWYSIWSALAHQGDVYSASFAAVPHVIQALSLCPDRATPSYFQFPAWVEVCRMHKGVTVPADLWLDYTQALQRLPTLIASIASREWGGDLLLAAMAALAVGKGFTQLAHAVLELTPDVVPEFLSWLESR